jgi:trimethylamine--corrinoid protein Co-methyltransferase
MALEVIREVGPGGEFLSHNHTFKNFRSLSQSELIDRRNRTEWEAKGSKDIVEKSYEKAIDLLENYQPELLPEETRNELDRILEEAEAETAEIKAKEDEESRKRRMANKDTV